MSYSIRVVTGDTRHTFSISDYRHIAEELGPIFGYQVSHSEDHLNPDGYWECDSEPFHWHYITSASYDAGRNYQIEQYLESIADDEDADDEDAVYDDDSFPADYRDADWDQLTIVPSTPGMDDASDYAEWYAACDYLMCKCESYLPILFDSDGPHLTYNSEGDREWHHGTTIATVYVAYDDDNDRPDDSYYTKDTVDSKGYHRTVLSRTEIENICGPEWTVHDNSDTNVWDDTSLWLMLVPADTTRFECGG